MAVVEANALGPKHIKRDFQKAVNACIHRHEDKSIWIDKDALIELCNEYRAKCVDKNIDPTLDEVRNSVRPEVCKALYAVTNWKILTEEFKEWYIKVFYLEEYYEEDCRRAQEATDNILLWILAGTGFLGVILMAVVGFAAY